MKINDCIFCKKQPKVVKIDGIYYVQCCAHKGYRDYYTYCGLKLENAIRVWNESNPEHYTISSKGIRFQKQKLSYIYQGKTYTTQELAKKLGIKRQVIYNMFFQSKKDSIIYKDEFISRIRKGEL